MPAIAQSDTRPLTTVYYVAPDTEPVNPFTEYMAGWLRARTPIAQDMWMRQLDAADPTKRQKLIADLIAQRVELEKSHDTIRGKQLDDRKALIEAYGKLNAEQVSSNATAEAAGLKARGDFRSEMARTMGSIANEELRQAGAAAAREELPAKTAQRLATLEQVTAKGGFDSGQMQTLFAEMGFDPTTGAIAVTDPESPWAGLTAAQRAQAGMRIKRMAALAESQGKLTEQEKDALYEHVTTVLGSPENYPKVEDQYSAAQHQAGLAGPERMPVEFEPEGPWAPGTKAYGTGGDSRPLLGAKALEQYVKRGEKGLYGSQHKAGYTDQASYDWLTQEMRKSSADGGGTIPADDPTMKAIDAEIERLRMPVEFDPYKPWVSTPTKSQKAGTSVPRAPEYEQDEKDAEKDIPDEFLEEGWRAASERSKRRRE